MFLPVVNLLHSTVGLETRPSTWRPLKLPYPLEPLLFLWIHSLTFVCSGILRAGRDAGQLFPLDLQLWMQCRPPSGGALSPHSYLCLWCTSFSRRGRVPWSRLPLRCTICFVCFTSRPLAFVSQHPTPLPCVSSGGWGAPSIISRSWITLASTHSILPFCARSPGDIHNISRCFYGSPRFLPSLVWPWEGWPIWPCRPLLVGPWFRMGSVLLVSTSFLPLMNGSSLLITVSSSLMYFSALLRALASVRIEARARDLINEQFLSPAQSAITTIMFCSLLTLCAAREKWVM